MLSLDAPLKAGLSLYSQSTMRHLCHSLTWDNLCSYLIADNVVYFVIADKSYPRKLAFSYLDELSKEFATTYGAKVESVRKPYAFVGFGALWSPLLPLIILRELLRYIHVQNGALVSRHPHGYCSQLIGP